MITSDVAHVVNISEDQDLGCRYAVVAGGGRRARQRTPAPRSLAAGGQSPVANDRLDATPDRRAQI